MFINTKLELSIYKNEVGALEPMKITNLKQICDQDGSFAITNIRSLCRARPSKNNVSPAFRMNFSFSIWYSILPFNICLHSKASVCIICLRVAPFFELQYRHINSLCNNAFGKDALIGKSLYRFLFKRLFIPLSYN